MEHCGVALAALNWPKEVLSSSMKSASFRPDTGRPLARFAGEGISARWQQPTIRANVRVIAATHRDLPAAIEAGTFRSDFYYRINVFPLEIRALRERKEDIRLLVKYFIHRYCSKAGKDVKSIDKKSLDRLQSYSWPGNIRELQNVIERSAILCDSENSSVDESWLSTAASPARPLSQEMVLQEKELIEAALAECKGRVSGHLAPRQSLACRLRRWVPKFLALKIDKRRFYAN